MRLIDLHVKGYRSLKELAWSPGDVNVVIGPNAGGKSNLLRALELLSASASGRLGRFVQRDGGMAAIVWDGKADDVRLAITADPGDSELPFNRLSYGFALSRVPALSHYQISEEWLTGSHDETPDSSVTFIERNADGIVPNGHADEYAPNAWMSSLELPPGETLLSLVAGPWPISRVYKLLQHNLANWAVYHSVETHRHAAIRLPQVARMETRIDPDGQNLIPVLHTLYTGDRRFQADINTAMRAAFGDEFEELVFPPAADQRIQMRVRWRSLQREQSTADLSDGTLRFLYLLTLLASPDPPPLMAIDEPETGLHPAMLPIITDFAREAASRSQVIFTTHSADFLDAFGDNPPATTVVESTGGETTLRTLSGDDLAYWLKEYSLGDLFRSRELEALP